MNSLLALFALATAFAAVLNKTAPPPRQPDAQNPDALKDKLMQEAVAKYRELYLYSTDVLLKEHERFTRADDKAAKYSATFVFLLGVFGYFDKWAFDHVTKRPDSYLDLPEEWPLLIIATLGLILSGVGWFLSNHVIRLRPFAARRLDNQILDFFDKQNLLNIYDSFARRNIEAFQENKTSTNKKYRILAVASTIMLSAVLLLGGLGVIYCLYSLF